MSHYDDAVRFLATPPLHHYASGNVTDYTPALTFAILALIDKLNELPVVGINVNVEEEYTE